MLLVRNMIKMIDCCAAVWSHIELKWLHNEETIDHSRIPRREQRELDEWKVLTERSADSTTFRYYGTIAGKHIRKWNHRLRVSFVTLMMKIDVSRRTFAGQLILWNCFETIFPIILYAMHPPAVQATPREAFPVVVASKWKYAFLRGSLELIN